MTESRFSEVVKSSYLDFIDVITQYLTYKDIVSFSLTCKNIHESISPIHIQETRDLYATEKYYVQCKLEEEFLDGDDILYTIELYQMNVNTICTENGKTLLMRLAEEGCLRNSTKWLERVLNMGADVNQQDKDGWTALIYACNGWVDRGYHNRDPETIQMLLNAGADTALLTTSEYNALSFLESAGDDIDDILDMFDLDEDDAENIYYEYKKNMWSAQCDN